MCEPISTTSLIVGGLTAGTGALGAIGQNQAQQDAVNAANQGRINNYKYQLQVRENNWMRANSQWENDKINYGREIADNSFAAQQGYADAQLQLNEQFKKAAFNQEGELIKLLSSQGEMAAAGRTGKSAARIDDAMLAEFGRNNAQRTASLVSSKQGYRQTVEEIQRQTRDANEQAFDNVAFAPQPDMAPMKPKMEKGPSGTSLALGLATAGLNGFTSTMAGQAPKGFIDKPIPDLKVPTGNNQFGSIEWAPMYSNLT